MEVIARLTQEEYDWILDNYYCSSGVPEDCIKNYLFENYFVPKIQIVEEEE